MISKIQVNPTNIRFQTKNTQNKQPSFMTKINSNNVGDTVSFSGNPVVFPGEVLPETQKLLSGVIKKFKMAEHLNADGGFFSLKKLTKDNELITFSEEELGKFDLGVISDKKSSYYHFVKDSYNYITTFVSEKNRKTGVWGFKPEIYKTQEEVQQLNKEVQQYLSLIAE